MYIKYLYILATALKKKWSSKILWTVSTFIKYGGCPAKTVTSESPGNSLEMQILNHPPPPTYCISYLQFNKPVHWSLKTTALDIAVCHFYKHIASFIPSYFSSRNFLYLESSSLLNCFWNAYSSFRKHLKRNHFLRLFNFYHFFFPPKNCIIYLSPGTFDL